MKIVNFLIVVFFLSGCATTNYTTLELSTAEIKNLAFSESKNLKKRKHALNIAFDYDISTFNDIDGLYQCSVQFILNNGQTLSIHKGTKSPCTINSASGRVSINWPTPIDESLNASKETLAMITYPIQFFVAIHQNTGDRQNQIIGKSELFTSEI